MEPSRNLHGKMRGITPDNEMSLGAIWAVLVNRKMIIFSAILVTLVLTALYISSMKSIYESRTVIRIGQVTNGAQVKLIESPTTLTYRLKEQYRVGDASEGKIKFPAVQSVVNDKRISNEVIVVTVQGYTPSEAQSFLINVTDKLLKEHKVLFDNLANTQQQHIQTLQKRIDEIKLTINQYDTNVNMNRDANPTFAGLLALEKNKLLDILPGLENELAQSKMEISPAFSFATEAIRKPTMTVQPILPKKSLLLSIGAIMGLFIGVLLAFGLEYVGKNNFWKIKN